MTEQEIIQMLKTNERGFMFLPKEVQEWAKKHRCNMRRLTYSDMSWTTPSDVFCESHVYRLMHDYPESAPLPELEDGLYYIKTDNSWEIARYVGIKDGLYLFDVNGYKSNQLIDTKWDIKKILTENVK